MKLLQGHNNFMIQRRIKLSILSIIVISFLSTFIIFFTDITSVDSPANIELSSSNDPLLQSPVDIEKITHNPNSISNTEAIVDKADTQNGQMVVMNRPIWKFDGKLIAQFKKLKSAAENGDNEASYILSMNLRYCYHSPVDDIALEKKLEEVYEFSDNQRAVNIITTRYEYCSGIEQEHRQQFYSYSEAAAKNGYVAAQEVIGRITPEFFMKSQGYQDLEREEFLIMRDAFVEQKIEFLQQAAQNGSIKALANLARMNRSQKVAGNGYANAFAFNQLILELTQSNKIYNRYSRYQQKLHSQLTSKEVDGAFEMYEKWLAIIKVNGTLYLITK